MNRLLAIFGLGIVTLACDNEEPTPPPASVEAPTPPPKNVEATPENASPEVKRFLAWYSDIKRKMDKDPAAVVGADFECFGANDPNEVESMRGICMADVGSRSVNWSKAEPTAFMTKEIVNLAKDVECGHFGAKMESRQGPIMRCKGDGEGFYIYKMGAMVTLGAFTATYLEHDPDLEQL